MLEQKFIMDFRGLEFALMLIRIFLATSTSESIIKRE